MPGCTSPRRNRLLFRLGRLAAAFFVASFVAFGAGIFPGPVGSHVEEGGPAGSLSEISDSVPVLEASSDRNAAPPAGIQADPQMQSLDAVVPGERWGAAGITYVIQGQEWDAVSLANVDQALASLPGGVLTALGNRDLGGVSILVNRSGRTLAGKQPYGQAANFFSTNDGRNELVLFPDQSPPTVLHELGHAYNLRAEPAGRYTLVLLEPEMQSFMAATGWRVLSSTGQIQAARDQTAVDFAYSGAFTWPRLSHNDPLEDFANSFALYFSSPADLKALSPERFAWFDANIGR
jgi:hypothetical protein